MRKVVSQEDIARELGLSKMTVSKALRGVRHVSPKTRERVLKTAEKMGYRPNPMVASLMQQVRSGRVQGRQSTVAFVSRSHYAQGLIMAQLVMKGAQERAYELGYEMEMTSIDDYASTSHMGRVLRARGIQGIVCGAMDSLTPWEGFPWHHFSVVAAGLGHARLPVPLVRRNVSQGVRMLAAKLEEAGLKRPAVLFRHRGDSELGLISEGAIKVMIEHGPGDMSLIHPWDSSPARVKAWLEEVQPDVIVLPYAPHLEILKGIGYGLDGPLPVVTLGLRGPDDLLSGVDVQSYACGQAAMEMLNLELQLNRTGLEENVRTLMIDCDWVEREAFSRFRRPQVLHQERDR